MACLNSALGAGALVLVLVLVLGGAACTALGPAGGGGSGASKNHAPPENTSTPVDALADPSHPGLEACAGSVSAGDLSDALEIASDFKESCHELIVCGGLATNFGTAVIDILLDAAIGGSSPAINYKGNGVYETGNLADGGTGVLMDITTTLGVNTSFGKTGDVINFNLLDLSTYFTGVNVTASASIDTSGNSSYNLGISFTGTGPGVELLGLGKNPSSPLTVNADAIAAALGQIRVQTHIHQNDMQMHSLFTYDVTGPAQSLSSALSGDPVPFMLAGVMGGRADLMQTISLTTFQINYLDTGSSGYMNGTIGFAVKGGKLPYKVTFVYPNRKEPDVTLACGN